MCEVGYLALVQFHVKTIYLNKHEQANLIIGLFSHVRKIYHPLTMATRTNNLGMLSRENVCNNSTKVNHYFIKHFAMKNRSDKHFSMIYEKVNRSPV